jgi:hypothetical protein
MLNGPAVRVNGVCHMHAATKIVLLGVTAAVWWLLFPLLGTALKDKWGINLHRVSCPNCGTLMPMVRLPSSIEQAMSGGWTCPRCRCRMDKWGRQIVDGASNKKIDS